MKRLLLFAPMFFCAAASFAQTACSQGHQIYKFDNAGNPHDVYKLGTDPEFPFLRNLSTPQKVVAALKNPTNKKKYARQYAELNTLLMNAGFANGVKDVTASAVSQMDVPPGTTGNMGDGHFNYIYAKFSGDKTYKAWKITSGDGCYITFLSPCGNAFYPGAAANATAGSPSSGCKDMAVALSEPREITVVDTVQQHVKTEVYVYYERPYGPRRMYRYGAPTMYKSDPILVETRDDVQPVAVTYKVSSTGIGHATVCNDTLQSVTTDIRIENESVYTGYRTEPEVRKEYKLVSEWEYGKADLGHPAHESCGCSSCRQ